MSDGAFLALDLSSRLGWAYGPPGRRTAGGVYVLPSVAEWGRQINAAMDVLSDMFDTLQPCAVILEAAMPLQAQTRDDTARQQFGLAAITYGMASRYEIPAFQERADKIRKAVVGTSRVPGKSATEQKRWLIDWCRRNGHPDMAEDNEADATIIHRYCSNRFNMTGRYV